MNSFSTRENCSKPPHKNKVKLLLFARTLKAHLKTLKSSRFRALKKTSFFPSFLLTDDRVFFFFCRCCCSVVVESSSAAAAAHYPKLQEKDDDENNNNNNEKTTKSDEDDNNNNSSDGRPRNLQSSGVERGGVSAVRDRDRTSRKRVPEKEF